jgi:hypothetical protein
VRFAESQDFGDRRACQSRSVISLQADPETRNVERVLLGASSRERAWSHSLRAVQPPEFGGTLPSGPMVNAEGLSLKLDVFRIRSR